MTVTKINFMEKSKLSQFCYTCMKLCPRNIHFSFSNIFDKIKVLFPYWYFHVYAIFSLTKLVIFCCFLFYLEALVDLMTLLVERNPLCCQTQHVGVLLGAYTASLSSTGVSVRLSVSLYNVWSVFTQFLHMWGL